MTAGVRANASEMQPARLLAVFMVDRNETELTIPSGKRTGPNLRTSDRCRSCGKRLEPTSDELCKRRV